MKKILKNLLWLTISIVAIVLFLRGIDWTLFRQAVGGMNWWRGIMALILYLAAQTMLSLRWQILLRIQQIHIPLFQTIKLTWLGLFFNNFMPGSVGGDLLKAWYITHHSGEGRKVHSMMTVLIDRLTGLAGMIVVGLIAGMAIGKNLVLPLGGYQLPIRYLVFGLLAGFILGAFLILSRRIRRFILPGGSLEKLPFGTTLAKIDEAFQIYRSYPWRYLLAVLLTICLQMLSIIATWQLSRALGYDQVTFLQCLMVLPIIWLISAAVPVPGGLGVMEYLFIPFFCRAIEPGAQPGTELWLMASSKAAALAFLNRMMICAATLPGALVPVFGGHLPKRTEMEQELHQES